MLALDPFVPRYKVMHVCFELDHALEIVLYGWRHPWSMSDPCLDTPLHEGPKNLDFRNPHYVLCSLDRSISYYF